ncbi:hypothetical protein WG915_04895 [Corynebacterium sp. H128]|uniref:hypothetical protein n=1 Tax=Corynebacterium sp. H128 TaxID=3133427 RepID=UPI0030A8EF94
MTLQFVSDVTNLVLATRQLKTMPPVLKQSLSEIGLKRCPGCKRVKETTAFARNRSSVDGFASRCLSCSNQALHDYFQTNENYRTNYYREHHEEERQRSHRWRQENWLLVRLWDGQRRARKVGLPAHDIDPQDLLDYWSSQGWSVDRCSYTGEALTRDTLHIDHVEPLCKPGSAGHVIANLRPSSLTFNTMIKRDKTLAELGIPA